MIVVSLFDMSGIAVADWALAGAKCYCFDLLNEGERRQVGKGEINFVQADLSQPKFWQQVIKLRPAIIFGFPPCTDLAVSGARHFKAKAEANPLYREKAIMLVKLGPTLAEDCGAEWINENPVGILSTHWKKPSYIFDPCDFGGYLPENDYHPRYSEYIEPRDAYLKKTCHWVSDGLRKPIVRPVPYISYSDNAGNRFSKQTAKLGGKSLKTKIIRSLTPRGWAKAFFLANFEQLANRQN